MAANEFGAEQPDNFERKVPCVVVIDTSGSMSGGPIAEASSGLQVFEREVLADSVAKQRVDLTVVTFDSTVRVVREFGLIAGGDMPALTAQGTTKLVDGVRKGVALLKDRIDWYFQTGQDCYRPYLIVITDGAPDPGQDVQGLKGELQALAGSGYDSPAKKGHPRKFNVFTIGVDGASPASLEAFSPTAPLALKSTNFREFFKYMGTLTKQVTGAKPDAKLDLSPGALGVANPFDVTA